MLIWQLRLEQTYKKTMHFFTESTKWYVVLSVTNKNMVLRNPSWAAIFVPHNSPVICAKELFKPLKDLASLGVSTEKKILMVGFNFLWVMPQVSKDLHFTQVSNKNLSEILPPSGLGPGADEVGKKHQKLLHLWRHSQKVQNQKFSFIANLMTHWCQHIGFRCTIYLYLAKNSSFWLPYQRHSSSTDWTAELIKHSKDSASLLIRNEKKILWLEFLDFLWVML